MPSSATETPTRVETVGSSGRSPQSVRVADVVLELPDMPISGRELILLVEDLYNRLSARTLQVNPFWRAMVDEPETVPDSVFHGMCIENYHLLFRESYFDSPVLSYPSSRRVRELINEFYTEELGHDRLLLKALASLDISEDDLYGSLPLAGTMALCNALSFWARHDPLFFFTTLGPLEGRDVEIDSFVTAARRKGLSEAFIGPILDHAYINKNSEHGLLTRAIFEEIPLVSEVDTLRVLRQTELFISVYDRFYSEVWEHYRSCDELLRPIDAI